MVAGSPGAERLDVRIVSADRQRFRCPGNVLVEPHARLESLGHYDAVLICDMYSPIHLAPCKDRVTDRGWLRGLIRRGVLIGSVCSGALILAEARRFAGREFSSHRAYTELFAKEFPNSRLRRDSIQCPPMKPRGS